MSDLSTLPKAQLHVHLESAVRWSTLRELGAANGVPVPEHLADPAYRLEGFADFFAQRKLVLACLRRPEDFYRVACEFCQDQAADGVRHVEVSFTAAAHGERLGDPEMPLRAVLDGLAAGSEASRSKASRSAAGGGAGSAAGALSYGVILDHSRRRPVERAWQTLELAVRHRDAGVIGIGLAGDEAYPLAPFGEVCRAARDAGLRNLHHAGEAAGPDSVREALTVGLADRIGHGINAIADPSLVAELRDRGIALEVCPSSNIALGFAGSYAEHPLPRLRDAGLAVSLHTDIPSLIHTTLTSEYGAVRDAYGWSGATLAELATASVDASFADAATKARIRSEIADWL
ncbi:MAG: adenosine deaminase family protein [Micromonosporaceae bacterium]